MDNWDRDIITAKPLADRTAWMVFHTCWDRTPNAKPHSLFPGAKGPMFALCECTPMKRITDFENLSEMKEVFDLHDVKGGIQRQIDDPTPMAITVEMVNGRPVIKVEDTVEYLTR